jgi:hypothetical protein
MRQTAAYVAGRIRKAGGDPIAIFTKEAVVLIHNKSAGIPRTISVVCDNAMLAGYAAGVKPIGPDIIEEVSRDFRLRGAGQSRSDGNNGRERPAGIGSDRPLSWDSRRADSGSSARMSRPDAAAEAHR